MQGTCQKSNAQYALSIPWDQENVPLPLNDTKHTRNEILETSSRIIQHTRFKKELKRYTHTLNITI